ADELRGGPFETRFGGELAGERRFVTGLSLITVGLVEVGFDLHDQLALLYRLAFLDWQFDDFTTHLGTDLYLQDRLDSAVGDDNFDEVASCSFLRLDRNDNFALPEDRDQRETHEHETDNGEDDDFAPLL